jgi:hypothetical protein
VNWFGHSADGRRHSQQLPSGLPAVGILRLPLRRPPERVFAGNLGAPIVPMTQRYRPTGHYPFSTIVRPVALAHFSTAARFQIRSHGRRRQSRPQSGTYATVEWAGAIGRSVPYAVRLRAATVRPAFHPGARPRLGGWTVERATPLRVSTHDVTEFEFHISPVASSSRPQTGVGMDGKR